MLKEFIPNQFKLIKVCSSLIKYKVINNFDIYDYIYYNYI